MAVAGIFVITEVVVDILEALPPIVRMLPVEGGDGTDHPGVLAVLGDVVQGLFQDSLQVGLHKGQADGAGHIDAAPHAVAAVGDAGGFFRQAGRLLWVAGGYQAPGVDEDLPADLLRHGGAVLLHTAAAGRGNAVAQVQISRMLGGDTIAAPPEKPVLIGGVVQQGIGHILGGKALQVLAVLQRADEEHGSVAVIIRGEVFVLGGILPQLSKHVLDALVGPALHSGSQPDADDLSQPAGIDAFHVIFWQFHSCLSFQKINL